MGDDMAAILEQLGYAQVDVLGYSLGGGVAFRLAVQHPEMRAPPRAGVDAASLRTASTPRCCPSRRRSARAMADAMKDTPMYKSYVAVAPHPEDFPKLLDRMGESMRQPYDWSEDVKTLRCPSCSSTATATCSGPSTSSSSTTCSAAGCRDAGWMREHMSQNRLAILPDLTHYEIFASPALVATVSPFLNGETHGASRSEGAERAA